MIAEQFLIAPVLLFLEVHNTLAKHFRREKITTEMFTFADHTLRQFIGFSEVDETLVESARFMSIYAHAWSGRAANGRTTIHPPFNIYDCIYIAHAKQHGTTLLTADKEQAAFARDAFKIPVELIVNAA